MADGDLEIFSLLMGLFGGLALFLFGMEQMSVALRTVAGDRMKVVLGKLTSNRFAGVATGAFVTAIIQSSSVTTVLVVGFITAGLMSLSQSIGVIMGANIGTTITAQIIAFKVTKYALLMIAIGFTLIFAAKNDKVKKYGEILFGLGLIFFGMGVMSESMSPLRSYQPFLDLMTQMESPLLGILLGAVFTALVQSSSATTGIVIVLATQGLISLPAGIAIAFGSNIGTCVTAMLSTIGKPREALRAAMVHVIFNVAGVLIWLGLINHLADWVIAFSPSHEELSGLDRLAAETPRQIANAHTVFNVANTFIFIWFTVPLAAFINWLIPDKVVAGPQKIQPKYLDLDLVQAPSIALNAARLEVGRIGSRIQSMMKAARPALLSGSQSDLIAVQAMDDEVDDLHHAVIDYLRQIGLQSLTEQESRELIALMSIANNYENMGDIIETDLVHIGLARVSNEFHVSAETGRTLDDLFAAVTQISGIALIAATQNDHKAAAKVMSEKAEISRLAAAAQQFGALRLTDRENPAAYTSYAAEVEVVEKLKRLYYFAKRIAKNVSPQSTDEDE